MAFTSATPSQVPVYDVSCDVYVDDRVVTTLSWDVLEPSSKPHFKAFVSDVALEVDNAPPSSQRVELEFLDASGTAWRRGPRGLLWEIQPDDR